MAARSPKPAAGCRAAGARLPASGGRACGRTCSRLSDAAALAVVGAGASHADSLLWRPRGGRSASPRSCADRARREGAEWPEMASGLIAAASEAFVGRSADAERSARASRALAREAGRPRVRPPCDAGSGSRSNPQSRSSAAESTYRVARQRRSRRATRCNTGAAHPGSARDAEGGGARRRAAPLRAGGAAAVALRNPKAHATARVGSRVNAQRALGEFEAEKRVYRRGASRRRGGEQVGATRWTRQEPRRGSRTRQWRQTKRGGELADGRGSEAPARGAVR